MLRGNVCEFMPEGWMLCPSCLGSGKEKGKEGTCSACDGIGRMPDPFFRLENRNMELAFGVL